VTVIIEGGVEFAVDLYRRLAGQTGNILCSPSSIRAALAMACAGAAAATERQMAVTLRLGSAAPARHTAIANLLAELNAAPLDWEGTPAYELSVANALWAQSGYPFRQSFVDLVVARYGGGLNEVDFAAPEAAAVAINTWVADRTRGRIGDIVAPAALCGLVRLVLANAVYFKSNWREPFERTRTRDGNFQLASGHVVSTPFMHQQFALRYLETHDFQAVEIPYRADVLAMMVLLPVRADDLAVIEQSLTAATLRQWLEGMGHHEVQLSLPRFRFASGFRLSEALVSMGMTDAFDAAAADFSGMTQAERFFLDCVLHNTFIAVDEEGTEAAAATAGVAAGAIEGEPEPPKVFTADRPFLFLIHHRPTDEVLFLGRLADPTAEE
jgi:serpin B